MYVVAIIAAGGRGRRLGRDRPKQLLEIGGRSLLDRSLEPFDRSDRVDEVIVFNPLDNEELRAIVDILLHEINLTLAERGLEVDVSNEAREWLLERAKIEPATGARPLRRTIQRHIQDAVSEILISRHGVEIGKIEVTVEGDELQLVPTAPEPAISEN